MFLIGIPCSIGSYKLQNNMTKDQNFMFTFNLLTFVLNSLKKLMILKDNTVNPLNS